MSAVYCLVLSKDGQEIREILLEGDLSLGRAPGNLVCLEDRAVSRHHASFKQSVDGVVVERKSEFAPIRVNGQECTRAVLKQGDVVEIGPYLLKMRGTTNAALPSDSMKPEAPEVNVSQEVSMVQAVEKNLEEKVVETHLPDFEGSKPLETNEESNSWAESQAQEEVQVEENQNAFEGEFVPDEEAPSSADESLVAAEPVDESGETRALKLDQFISKLVVKVGKAQVAELTLEKPTVSIGRSKKSDLILEDKKCSRDHAILEKRGAQYLYRDLGTVNGSYLNGEKQTEKLLESGDQIQIGQTIIEFQALDLGYENKINEFLPVPTEDELDSNEQNLSQAEGAVPGSGAIADAPTHEIGGIAGITGVAAAGSEKKSLVEKFRALPKQKQMIYGAVALVAAYVLIFDESDKEKAPAKNKAPKPSASVLASPSTKPLKLDSKSAFEKLPAEQQQFVENQHQLAFRNFTNKEYDKALYEVRKIFDIVPDYKNAREIERYALDGQRILKAAEDERRKREEEEAFKKRLADLLAQASDLMLKKDFENAKPLFGEILAVEPDNAQVKEWQQEIEDYEQSIRIEEQNKNVQNEINSRAWGIYNQALEQKKKGQCHSAMATFAKVSDSGTSDPKILGLSKQMIQSCRSYINNRRDPLLKEAKAAEAAGEGEKAFQLYKKATVVDPPHLAGYQGMNRIRGTLHEKAKVVYTEAVLAESYSDFVLAKAKFEETLRIAPQGDAYHEKAKRKLDRFPKHLQYGDPEGGSGNVNGQ